MRVRFSLDALAHIATFRRYIETSSGDAAAHVSDRIYAEAFRLGRFPYLGHRGQVSGTYEWTVRKLPFVIAYELDGDDQLIVIGVYHCAQHR